MFPSTRSKAIKDLEGATKEELLVAIRKFYADLDQRHTPMQSWTDSLNKLNYLLDWCEALPPEDCKLFLGPTSHVMPYHAIYATLSDRAEVEYLLDDRLSSKK